MKIVFSACAKANLQIENFSIYNADSGIENAAPRFIFWLLAQHHKSAKWLATFFCPISLAGTVKLLKPCDSVPEILSIMQSGKRDLINNYESLFQFPFDCLRIIGIPDGERMNFRTARNPAACVPRRGSGALPCARWRRCSAGIASRPRESI